MDRDVEVMERKRVIETFLLAVMSHMDDENGLNLHHMNQFQDQCSSLVRCSSVKTRSFTQ